MCARSFIQEEFRTRLLITSNSGSTKLSHSWKKKNATKTISLSVFLCLLLSTMMIWDSSSACPVLTFDLSRNGGTQKFRTRVDVRSTTKSTRWTKRCMSRPRRAEHAHAVLRHVLYFHTRCMIGTIKTNKKQCILCQHAYLFDV